MFVVLRLIETVDVTDPFGNDHPIQIKGIRGFLPVYETIEEATESANNGKYQIFEIAEVKNEN